LTIRASGRIINKNGLALAFWRIRSSGKQPKGLNHTGLEDLMRRVVRGQ